MDSALGSLGEAVTLANCCHQHTCGFASCFPIAFPGTTACGCFWAGVDLKYLLGSRAVLNRKESGLSGEWARGSIERYTDEAMKEGQMTDDAPVKLTDEQAYAAMFHFLDLYYKRGNSDEIGGLLGAMSLSRDGSPMDPGYLDDWKKAIAFALAGGRPPTINIP